MKQSRGDRRYPDGLHSHEPTLPIGTILTKISGVRTPAFRLPRRSGRSPTCSVPDFYLISVPEKIRLTPRPSCFTMQSVEGEAGLQQRLVLVDGPRGGGLEGGVFMELREALTQITEIRLQMARTEVFRGYRAVPAAFRASWRSWRRPCSR